MPRYVILQHDHPFLHWDLLLETGAVLRSWRLLEKPEPEKTIMAEATFDHRLVYLDFEGPVSGDRGDVIRWDRGEYEMLDSTSDLLRFLVRSPLWSGTASLQRCDGDSWLFTFHDD